MPTSPRAREGHPEAAALTHAPPLLLCSFNINTMQVATTCSCCHPISSYEEQLVLPCEDPAVQGQQLVLTMQVFSSCACCRRRCGD